MTLTTSIELGVQQPPHHLLITFHHLVIKESFIHHVDSTHIPSSKNNHPSDSLEKTQSASNHQN